MDYTFGLIKSHAFWKAPEIIAIIKREFIIRAQVGASLSPGLINQLYAAHLDKPYWPDLRESVSGPVVALVLQSPNAVANWRFLMGPTDPKKAKLEAPHTLRAHFGNLEGPLAQNAVHGSDSEDSARLEIGLFFPGFVFEEVVS